MSHAITVPQAAQVQRANRRRPAPGTGCRRRVGFSRRAVPRSARAGAYIATCASGIAAATGKRRGRGLGAATAPERITIEPAPAPASQEGAADTPAFDLTAARAAARLITRAERKALVTVPGRQPVIEPHADTRLNDRIDGARRADCKTARAECTNLLTNVVLLAKDMVANVVDDSGCKW